MDKPSMIPRTVSRRGVVVAAVATGAALLIRSKPESVQPLPLADNRDFPDPSFLTTPDALYQMLVVERTIPNLLDASSLANFRSRHINGAQGVWWQDTMQLNSIFFGTVLKPDEDESQGRRQRLLEKWNIRAGLPTVVYDDTDGLSACRIAWFLRFMGIDATVLDGGLAAWLAIDVPTTDDDFEAQPGDLVEARPQEGFYLVSQQVADRLENPNVKIVDLRETSERRTGSLAGFSIPGAANMPRSLFLGPGGGIRDPQSLEALLEQAVISPDQTLILMAPTGMDARQPWVALQAMGAKSVSICDGGWQEWATIPGVPLESLAHVSPD